MKKLFIMLIFAVVAMAVSAQGSLMTFTSTYKGDTLTNSETSYAYSPVLSNLDQTGMFQLTATNLTGTTAGTAYLQESIDGTTYKTINATNTSTMQFTTNDTLTLINGATQIWKLLTTPAYKYRIAVVQTGTSTSRYVAYWFVKAN